MGTEFIGNMKSTHLRMISLYNTFLSGSGSSLVSCLTRLPLLSYLGLFKSGLLNVEFIQVRQVLPRSCPNFLYLNIDIQEGRTGTVDIVLEI